MKPEQLWQSLVDEAGEDEIALAASMSVAQAAGELRELGFDVEAERARAETFLDGFERIERVDRAPAEPLPTRPAAAAPDAPPRLAVRRRPAPTVLWLAAAATVAVGGAAAYTALHEGEAPAPAPPSPSSTAAPSSSTPTAPPSPSAPVPELVGLSAAELRARAAVACKAGRGLECLELLDQAADVDPAGDKNPEIRTLRRKAVSLSDPKPH